MSCTLPGQSGSTLLETEQMARVGKSFGKMDWACRRKPSLTPAADLLHVKMLPILLVMINIEFDQEFLRLADRPWALTATHIFHRDLSELP